MSTWLLPRPDIRNKTMARKRVKWVHPLKGRTIKQTIADVFDCYKDSDVWENRGHLANVSGGCRWGVDRPGKEWTKYTKYSGLHSWCTMKDCLKYGFDVCDTGEITANDGDWNRKD